MRAAHQSRVITYESQTWPPHCPLLLLLRGHMYLMQACTPVADRAVNAGPQRQRLVAQVLGRLERGIDGGDVAVSYRVP